MTMDGVSMHFGDDELSSWVTVGNSRVRVKQRVPGGEHANTRSTTVRDNVNAAQRERVGRHKIKNDARLSPLLLSSAGDSTMVDYIIDFLNYVKHTTNLHIWSYAPCIYAHPRMRTQTYYITTVGRIYCNNNPAAVRYYPVGNLREH